MTQEIKDEPTDLVWLPVSLVKKINDLQDTRGVEKEILSYIEETKIDLRIGIESIDEDILLYRAQMIKARDAFKAAKNEELEGLYALWEGFDKERCKLGNMVKEAKNAIAPLRTELVGLRQEIENVNSSIDSLKVDKLLDFVQTLGKCKNLVALLSIRLFLH